MKNNLRLFFASSVFAAVVGCYTGSAVDTNRSPNGSPSVSTDGTDPSNEEGGDDKTGEGKGAPSVPTGLPCDVASLLTTSCAECHGAHLENGAPNRLLSYEDLTAPSEGDPSQTVAEVSLARMKSTKRPMPPDAKLGADRIAVLETWIKSGMPRGTCNEDDASTGTPKKDASAPATDGGVDAAPPQTSVCTSGSFYSSDAGVGPLMAPGKTCLACHAATGAKTFFVAGTVYPTLHEPNNCNGSSAANLNVVLIDANGVSHTVPVNAAGNFVRVTSFPLPYRALVVRGTSVREMKTPQTDGDCNGCHSEWGNKSPGRVMAP